MQMDALLRLVAEDVGSYVSMSKLLQTEWSEKAGHTAHGIADVSTRFSRIQSIKAKQNLACSRTTS